MKSCSVKDCIYPSWGKDKKTGLPYCSNHQYLRTDIDRRSIAEKHMDKMKKQGQTKNLNSQVRGLINTEENKLVANAAAEDIDKLQRFFDIIAKEIAGNPQCWECGAFIPVKYYRAATAHILPKAIFKSIATHSLNYLILGAGCGCHNKTHRLDTFSTMKIFPEAVSRFEKFQYSITEKHSLLDEFKMYVEKYNQTQNEFRESNG